MRGVKDIKVIGMERISNKNGYFVEVSFDGKGRGLIQKEMGPFSEKELNKVKDILEVVNTCMDECPRGIKDYCLVDGFSEWFEDDYHAQSIAMERIGGVFSDYAAFLGVTVYFYLNGIQYPCRIIWEGVDK